MKVWNKRDRKRPVAAVYVGRPSKWGNPFRIGVHGTRDQVIERYIEWLNETEAGWAIVDAARKELRGRDLVCWCSPHPCHADILLEIANT